MKPLMYVTNLPGDDCDILVEYQDRTVLKVTDCEGNELSLTEDEKMLLQGEIDEECKQAQSA